ncbi:MAG: hypothetical protein ACRYGI_18675 [Janthinobacterium lividum]
MNDMMHLMKIATRRIVGDGQRQRACSGSSAGCGARPPAVWAATMLVRFQARATVEASATPNRRFQDYGG